MLRLLAFPFVSVMLVTILMTSPLVPLLGKEYCTAIILGSSEEENNSNETTGSKSFESKYFLLRNFFPVDTSFNQEQDFNSLGYIFPVLDYTVEILDPPPRRLI
ncbi:MAG: hypothetical protein NXH86_06250 [Flavobacteriaceae bacterium]|uniref:hypothetical protein n=1 Tax=Flagellimonas TaxID=444459 RepID=UPI000E386A93|nr:hypothetical protein [Allomuricauda sp.]MCR9263739.1 hypothetical protein [Flavobacteriaceae bacterium]